MGVNHTFLQNYTLTTNFYDVRGHISMQGMMDLLQNAAARHAHFLGAGSAALAAQNFFWVIARTEVVIKDITTRPTSVDVRTWPKTPTRFYYDRQSEIINSKTNEVIAIARSRWLLLNSKTRTISNTSVYKYPLETFNETNYFDEAFTRLEHATTSVGHYTVRPSDIDENGHLNNSRYGNIVYDFLRLTENEQIISFTFNYVNEALIDDKIRIFCDKTQSNIIITGKKDDTILFDCKVVIRNVNN